MKLITHVEAQTLLSAELVGQYISRVSLGDTWDLCFSNDSQLVCQVLDSPSFSELSENLWASAPHLLKRVDPEEVPMAAILVGSMRREVSSVKVDSDGVLTIHLESDLSLVARVDTPVVDWQWSWGDEPQVPYHTPFRLACFWSGELSLRDGTTHAA